MVAVCKVECLGHRLGDEPLTLMRCYSYEECAGSHSVDRQWKRWIDAVKECLKKRGLDIRPARRMV